MTMFNYHILNISLFTLGLQKLLSKRCGRKYLIGWSHIGWSTFQDSISASPVLFSICLDITPNTPAVLEIAEGDIVLGNK